MARNSITQPGPTGKGNKQVEDMIVRSRVQLLLNHPFYGNLATRLIIVDGSGWIPTAGTDGRHLYYNVDFFSKMTREEIDFVVAHEVMHCVYDHMSRRGSRDKRLWNCSGDYVINLELVDNRIGRLPTTIDGLYDTRFRNMFTEEIFDILKEENDNGKGDGDADSFDVHIDMSPDGDDSGDSDGQKGDSTGKNGPIPLSKEQKHQIKDEIKQAVMQAAKAAGAGNTPAGVKRLINELTDPQMDWREILNMCIQSCIKSDFTFQRPSRKAWGSGIYLPGMLNDFMLDVDIAIDTSGSISERMLRDFLGEIKGIMEQFAEFKLRLWTFDTAVHNMQEFSSDGDGLESLLEYDIQGGGGTEFMVNWDYMEENGIEPHKFIVFTDGYPFGSWGNEDYCDTVFLISGNKEIVAPFGLTVYYEE